MRFRCDMVFQFRSCIEFVLLGGIQMQPRLQKLASGVNQPEGNVGLSDLPSKKVKVRHENRLLHLVPWLQKSLDCRIPLRLQR